MWFRNALSSLAEVSLYFASCWLSIVITLTIHGNTNSEQNNLFCASKQLSAVEMKLSKHFCFIIKQAVKSRSRCVRLDLNRKMPIIHCLYSIMRTVASINGLSWFWGCFRYIFNPLTPNDPYRGRTAPLTSKVAFYIFIQQI